jgi:hypothetical protein
MLRGSQVLAQKTRMPQLILNRLLTELDLHDQLRLDPHAVFHFLPC